MNNRVDTKRVLIYLGFAFGIAWITGLVISLTGGLENSPVLVPEMNVTLALVLLPTAYMWAPALANIFTRLLTREGWSNSGLRLNLKRGWPFWLAAWFGPAILSVLGGVAYFALFPQFFDPGLSIVRNQYETLGMPVPDNLWPIIITNLSFAVLISPLINSLFTFGEEFGWRGYLLPKLLPLGMRKAAIIMGIIWGVWHWPVIAMGHNYGLGYPGAPWLGMLAMVWFTFVAGTFLAWVTIRGGSVWPAVIGHAAVNGIGGAMILFVQGQPSLLLGPAPVGLIGSAAWSVVALWLLFRLEGSKQPADIASTANSIEATGD